MTWHLFERMAFSAGLKPWEFDGLPPQRIWNVIDGHFENQKSQWEMTRAICFNVAKFGNTDPKHFPKSLVKFWPLPWEQTQGAKEFLSFEERMAKRGLKLK